MADPKKDEMTEQEKLEADEGIYTLTDEEGNDVKFQLIGEVEMDGNHYYAMVPVDADEEDDDYGYVILKAEKDENGEDMLSSVDDDDEFDKVADYFDDQFDGEIDYDK